MNPTRRVRRAWHALTSEDARYQRNLTRATIRDMTPPPPSAYGAYGEGTHVVPPARVTRPDRVFLGDRVTIHEHAWISVVEAVDGVVPELRIGDDSSIGRFCHIACVGSISFGHHAYISDRLFVADTYHRYEDVDTPVRDQPMMRPEPVVVGDNVYMGIGVTILMGVTIGSNCVIGGGAVVTSDVPDGTVVVGNPARAVKRHDPATGRWEPIDTP